MYRKNCDRCNRPSFSSCEAGEWLCPVCGHDLTKYPFFQAMTLEKVTVLPHLNKSPYKKDATSNKSPSSLWG